MVKENKVAIYAIVANKDEIEVELQLKYIEEYLLTQNIKAKKVYIDNGFSRTTIYSPSFKKIVEDIKNKDIDTIYVKNLSILGGNQKELMEFSENILNKYNSKLILLDDKVDFKDVTTLRKTCKEIRKKDLNDRRLQVKKFKESR